MAPQVIVYGIPNCATVKEARTWLEDHGIAYEQFELSDDVGGNWYFKNPNGRSSVYESLHIDTSKHQPFYRPSSTV